MFEAPQRITAEDALQEEYFGRAESSEGYHSPPSTPTPTPSSSSDASCVLNSSSDSGIQEP